MANENHAYVVQRKTDEGKIYYVVVVNGGDIYQADTQKEAADWALEQEDVEFKGKKFVFTKKYVVHVSRVRDLPSIGNPNHWRVYP